MFQPKKFSAMMAVLLAIAVAAPYALADGEPPPRPATAAEKAHYAKSVKALSGLLPAMPAGWEKSQDEIPPIDEMAAGQDKLPWTISIECLYEKKQPVDMEQTNRDLDAFGDMASRMDELTSKLNDAMDTGDQAEIARIQAEIEALTQNSAAMRRYRDIEAENRRSTARVTMTINFAGMDNYGYEKIPAPPGAVAALRRIQADDRTDTTQTAMTYIFIGNFSAQEQPDDIQVYPDPKWTANHYMMVQNVCVAIEAVPEVCDDMIKRMNWKALNGLVK